MNYLKNRTFVILKSTLICLMCCALSVCGDNEDDEIEFNLTDEQKEAIAKQISEWNRPFEFYGKVVDQNGNQVSGVDIEIDVTYYCKDAPNPYWPGVPWLALRKYALKTDENGMFHVQDKGHGVHIRKMKKKGYENILEYKGRDRDVPANAGFNLSDLIGKKINKDSPVIYRMRKLDGEPTFIVRERRHYAFGKVGETCRYDMIFPKYWNSEEYKRRPYDLSITLLPGNDDKSFRLHIKANGKGAGVQLLDEYLYTAPAEGYQPEITLEVSTEEIKEDRSALAGYLKNYYTINSLYMRGYEGKFYARIKLKASPPMQGKGALLISTESWVNPFSSRNLEEGISVEARQKGRDKMEKLYKDR